MWITFLTFGISETAFATLSEFEPKTKTCTSSLTFDAADIAFKVKGLSSLLLCSAINNTDI